MYKPHQQQALGNSACCCLVQQQALGKHWFLPLKEKPLSGLEQNQTQGWLPPASTG